ncbi:MAG: hypothetical protein GDA43_17690 [Hormoscilla sp. SP5CHS1]|nr:hypothetical protein [Hormoscilla sp. SP5CHS1]
MEAALEAGSAALRERALERILNNLLKLQAQLPGLGLEAPAIKRWQPILEHWYKVIDLELKQQQVQSQGELLNPFSYVRYLLSTANSSVLICLTTPSPCKSCCPNWCAVTP